MNKNKLDVRKLVYLGLLTAIVCVLTMIPIRIGNVFAITLVLTPIVVGVATCGIWAGAWLGFAFGLTVLISGDAALFLQFNIPATIFVVLLKGTVAGLAAGGVYKLIERINRYAAIFAAAIVAPLVNTGIFFLGCEIFFFNDIAAYYGLEAAEVTLFVITGFIGLNFIVEMAVNLIIAPTVCKILDILDKSEPKRINY